MATSHPYISGPGNLAQMIKQLRSNFPGTVTSETVKKLGIAPNNESYIINALQFLGVINEEGKKTEKGGKVLAIHKDEDFKKGFEDLVRTAYKDLFDLHGDKVWEMDGDGLVDYFRQSDQTSAAIGHRQAKVFQTFAALAGHGEIESKPNDPGKKKAKSAAAAKKTKTIMPPSGTRKNDGNGAGTQREFAMTVRIEINLPPNGTAETYDSIFKSIKVNLLNE
jgi:hypothetical protein